MLSFVVQHPWSYEYTQCISAKKARKDRKGKNYSKVEKQLENPAKGQNGLYNEAERVQSTNSSNTNLSWQQILFLFDEKI